MLKYLWPRHTWRIKKYYTLEECWKKVIRQRSAPFEKQMLLIYLLGAYRGRGGLQMKLLLPDGSPSSPPGPSPAFRGSGQTQWLRGTTSALAGSFSTGTLWVIASIARRNSTAPFSSQEDQCDIKSVLYLMFYLLQNSWQCIPELKKELRNHSRLSSWRLLNTDGIEQF